MIISVVLTGVLILIVASFLCIPWQTHLDMTKDYSKVYGKANYKKFIEEFEKIDWNRDDWFENSYFHYESDSKIHANIYKFNGKGMLMRTPYDYYRVYRYLKNKRNTVNWD